MLIARLFTALDAHLLQSRLEVEGVPAVVVDDNIVQTNPFLTLAVGGVRVFVPSRMPSAHVRSPGRSSGATTPWMTKEQRIIAFIGPHGSAPTDQSVRPNDTGLLLAEARRATRRAGELERLFEDFVRHSAIP